MDLLIPTIFSIAFLALIAVAMTSERRRIAGDKRTDAQEPPEADAEPATAGYQRRPSSGRYGV